jgi:ubiquinone/menaquinone biosynthesis C-methylase UbiE
VDKKRVMVISRILEDMSRLRELWGGFFAARVLMTSNHLRLFDVLIRPKAAEEIAKQIGTDKRATRILLDALTALGLLKKTKNRYTNTVLSHRFLVSGKPYYQGDILKHADTLWKNWSALDEVIKTGHPHNVAHDHVAFIQGMHNLAVLRTKKVLNVFNLRHVRTALDLGGGPGTYAVEMARRSISVKLFDRPETISIARKMIRASGVRGIEFIEGDFLYDDFGKGYDLIFISQVCHSYSEMDNLNILEKSRKALNPGGRILIQEFYIDEDRTYPLQAALFSINMLVGTESGRCYSSEEIKGWLSKVGFKDIKSKPVENTILIQGTM